MVWECVCVCANISTSKEEETRSRISSACVVCTIALLWEVFLVVSFASHAASPHTPSPSTQTSYCTTLVLFRRTNVYLCVMCNVKRLVLPLLNNELEKLRRRTREGERIGRKYWRCMNWHSSHCECFVNLLSIRFPHTLSARE